MSDPVTPPAPVVPPEPVTPPAPVVPAVAPVEPSTPEADPAAGLDAHSQKVIDAIRGDFKKERAARIAAEDRAADQVKQIGKALGLVQDETDPVKLTEQIAASRAKERESELKLAVYQAADAAGGDPIALLDSRAFLEKVATLEPSDTVGLADAITKAVTDNSRLAKAIPGTPSAPGMRPNPAQGSSASQPLGLEAQISAAERADSGVSLRERMVLKAQLAAQKK